MCLVNEIPSMELPIALSIVTSLYSFLFVEAQISLAYKIACETVLLNRLAHTVLSSFPFSTSFIGIKVIPPWS